MNHETINEISNKVKDKGVFLKKNFFDREDLSIIENSLLELVKKEKKIYFPIKFHQFIIKLLKFEYKKFATSKKLIDVSNKLKLKTIASNILGREAYLETLDCYLSKKSNNQILEWHNDIGYNPFTRSKKDFYDEARATMMENIKGHSRGVKFFVYLTNVKSNNGALGVIPFSHKIVTALTKLVVHDEVDLKPYWKLKDLREFLASKNVRDKITESVNIDQFNKFINFSKFIDLEKDTHDFDYQAEKNSGIIFNELCVHRGSAPTKNDRLVLRYLYRKKK